MHVSTTTRRSGENEYNATLLRRSYRQDGKVKKETLANLSHLPPEAIDAIRAVLAGKTVMSVDQAFEIERSLPAGHVTAALTMARRLGLAKLLDRSPCRERDLCVAMIVGRVIGPGSKLGMVRTLGQSTLAQECGVVGADEDDLYAAMDWLVERQDRIEDRLAARHLRDGEMVLYDVSSSYFEGRTCPLGKRGYSRDGRPGLPQIIYGLLCDTDGRPVAVEVFTGELHDDKTLPSQVVKLKDRFGLSRVVVVADRGMVTKANITLLSETDGVDWITALKAPTIKKRLSSSFGGDLRASTVVNRLLSRRFCDDIRVPELAHISPRGEHDAIRAHRARHPCVVGRPPLARTRSRHKAQHGAGRPSAHLASMPAWGPRALGEEATELAG